MAHASHGAASMLPFFKIAHVTALFTLVACGDPTAPPSITPDAPPDDPPADNVVFVELFGSSPVFVRYRTGDGDWQEPVDTGDGYELLVGDDYELVAACENEFGSDVGFIASTFAEGALTYIPCFASTSSSAAAVEVTGAMTTPGAVYLDGGRQGGDAANWSFAFDVGIGTHDLIAIDADRAIVQRDLEILGDTALPAIDTTDGAALVDRSFTTNATAGEDVTTSVLWFTGNATAFIPLGGTTVKVPPASLVAATDLRYLSIDAAVGNAYRSVYLTDAAAAASQIDIEFLPALADVAFNADGVTWSGTLPGDDADLYFYENSSSVSINASAGWLAGRNKLAIDTDIPGFDPAWRVDDPDYRGFSVGDSTGQGFRSSSIYDFGSAIARSGVDRDRSHRRRLARLR